MRSVFGWDLPPGVTNRMIEEQCAEGPCEVCGQVDDCLCEECPECGVLGDPKCYAEHGMKRTKQQLISYAEYQLAILKNQILEQEQYIVYLKHPAEDDFYG